MHFGFDGDIPLLQVKLILPRRAFALSSSSSVCVFMQYLLLAPAACRRTWPPLIAVAARPTQQSSSSQGGHSGHELKQLFVVQHPGESECSHLLGASPPYSMT